MRTTVKLDPQVAAAVLRLREDQNLSLSQAVNQLAIGGLQAQATAQPGQFEQATFPLGLRIDISNIAETLELVEGLEAQ